MEEMKMNNGIYCQSEQTSEIKSAGGGVIETIGLVACR
jgi:hypothetical protein